MIAYEVDLRGPADPELAARLQTELDLITRKARGVPSIGVLNARLQRDLTRIDVALRAFGYYDGSAQGAIAEGTTPRVTVIINQGHLFTIGRYDVVWKGSEPDVALEFRERGRPASGSNIVAAEERLLATLKDAGYFDAKIADRIVVLNRQAGTVDVTVTFEAGQLVRVGDFEVKGKTALSTERVASLSRLRPGELLTPRRLKEAEDDLIASALFNDARIEPVGTKPARTIRITVENRLPRSVSGAVGYSVEDGYSVQTAWEHRNLFGDAERLRAELTLGSQRQSLNLTFRRYDTIFAGHTLLATLDLVSEDVDNQKYQQAALIGTLETEIFRNLTFRYGGSIEYVHDETVSEDGDYALIGLRAELSYNGANDLLDPTEGYRFVIRANPYLGWNNDLRRFITLETIGTAYFPFDRGKKFVGALRARLGTILGDSRDDIPIAKRFFAGGGGSIRGFGYKRAGPVDAEDSPLGGNSVIEINAELRYRINDEFGAVVFVDGGGAFDDVVPTDIADFFVGVGVGVRYYSPIGPVRLDVAFPIEGRDGEPDYQVYVSVGQAF